ncbi:hypothetical protein SAMCFNEI73_pB0190 (plasmid) [Sinorhizobium americanum]|uniref:Uncharacterized protein n=1 Tax=Sinorhizobium americanum TaxID=194963 RepID=A0A1L3LTH8_9HYPH|nr:hypothetical protein SAMCFNEI73_pB0190 [Sinorhizobium americanum]
MASTLASDCPASTSSPFLTRICVITPGMGQGSCFDVSAAFFTVARGKQFGFAFLES